MSSRPSSHRPALGLALLGAVAAAQAWAAEEPAEKPAADKPAEQAAAPDPGPAPWYKRIALHASADTYYGWNFNRPADGANFIPGIGTTAKRANEFGLNLATVELNMDPEPLGVRVVLNYGHGTEVLHAAEPEGTATGVAVWRYIQEANVSYKAPVGNGLIFTGGIYPCHIGFEVLASKDNWNYTRSWISDMAPFYQAGIRVSYPFTKNFSAQFHVMNGWQLIADNNAAKTFGVQLMWNSEKVTAALNTLSGPETPGNDSLWRFLGDFYLIVRPRSWLNLALVADLGFQQFEDRPTAIWYAGEGYLQFIPVSKLAIALRGGFFRDADNGISGAEQTLAEGTATIEVRPIDGFSLKLEGRYDYSTAPVFASSERAEDGSIIKVPTQALLVLGGVAYF